MHGLQACLFKYITVAAFHIYAQCGEDAAKRRGWNSHGNYIVDHGKSCKIMVLCFFAFLWESCINIANTCLTLHRSDLGPNCLTP